MVHRKQVSKGYMVLRERKKAKNNKRDYLDTKWRAAVRAKYGPVCEKCPNTNNLAIETHHVISRRVDFTRHVTENGVRLCKSCHNFAHNHATLFHNWILEKRGEEWWQELNSYLPF